MVHAACALRPDRTVIAIGRDDFPTDRYVVAGIARARGMTVRDGCTDLADVAVAVRSVVDYRTAQLADIHGETDRARAAGALVVWDLSHAAGAIEVDLTAAGADLAVGCTYKYLNGGPGAPAFSFVRRDLQRSIDQPIWGWFGNVDQFAMGPAFTPQDDLRRLLLGTPSVLSLAAADEGIALTAAAGIRAVHAKARELTSYALDLCDALGLQSPTPRDANERGAHVAVTHARAGELVAALLARNVVTDHRMPDIVRIGCSPLTTRYVDVFDGLTCLAEQIRSLQR
jgi:kynureninase